jgi:hypothetical protein
MKIAAGDIKKALHTKLAEQLWQFPRNYTSLDIVGPFP